MATWWKRHFGSLSRSDEPDGEETVSRKESVTMPYGAGKKTVVETKKTDEKEPLFNIPYGTPQSLPVSQVPEFDDVLSPKRGDPQLTVNNLLSTVPVQPLGAGYYKPIKDTPAITGYTTGQSGVNIPIFDSPGNIFPMGLWDERRRSLLNAYSMSQSSSQPSVDMWKSPEVHVYAQNMVNQSWVEDAKKLYSQAYAAGKVKDLKRPGTEYGDRYIGLVNDYKTIAATINRAVAYAETVLDPNNMEEYNPFQRMLATKLVNGDVSDVSGYARISKVLYQMPDYDKRMQDTAKSLMEYAEQPPTDEDKKYIMDKFGYTSQDLTEFIKTPNGGNLVRFMTSMKKIDDGTYDNIASRLGFDFQDKYRVEYGKDDLTPQEIMDMAKNDLKEYLRTKYNVSSNVLQAPSRTNVNIGTKESDESYVGAYVTSYRQNKQGFDDILGKASQAMIKGDFQSARQVFNQMNSFTDAKGRKLFHFVPNSTDNENSVIKWRAVGENPPMKVGDKKVVRLREIYDDLIRDRKEKEAKEVSEQIKIHGENAAVEFVVSGIDGVFLEPHLNKPVTYKALANVGNASAWTGESADTRLDVIQPGWAYYMSSFKPTKAGEEDDAKKINLPKLDYTVYENLEYSPGQEASETSISPGQRSWELLNK